MRTVLRADGFIVKIYFNDHAPAHVHVFKSGTESVIALEPVILLRVWRMTQVDVSNAMRMVKENRNLLPRAWQEIGE
jgi:hypothetical protein